MLDRYNALILSLLLLLSSFSYAMEESSSSTQWSLIQGFPSACGGSQVVQGVGRTLTCVTPSGGSGSSVLAISTGTTSQVGNPGGTYISSPTAVINFNNTQFYGSLRGNATAFISLDLVSLSTGVYGTVADGGNVDALTITQNDVTNNKRGMVITSTGTGVALQVVPQGITSNGYQNKLGAVTIGDDNAARPFTTMLVIVDSTTDNQQGGGLLEIWEDNPNHNDPLLWMHRTPSNSAPEFRIDSNAPNMEVVNTSTANAIGRGKWEVWAMPNGGAQLQLNSRAYDNSTFENMILYYPLSCKDSTQCALMAGMYLAAQSVTNDSAVISSSDTLQIGFTGLNSSIVGLTGPQNPSASWAFALPNTFNNLGQVLYQSDNGRGGNMNARSWAFTTGGTTGNFLQYNSGAAPTWSNTFVSSVTALANVLVSSGMAYSRTTKTASYTMGPGDHVLFAQSPGIVSTITLSLAATMPGQRVVIYKTDTSTTPVRIAANAADTIAGVSTITLQTYGMSQELISDGANTWFSWGKLNHPAAYLGNYQDVASAAALTSSTTYFQAWELQEPCDTKNIQYHIGTTGGNINFGIYNEFGVQVLSTGPFTTPANGANASTAIPLKNLQPGIYYLGFNFDNGTATVTRYMSNIFGPSYSLGNATTALPTSLGSPPAFTNLSARSPAVTVQCYGGSP